MTKLTKVAASVATSLVLTAGVVGIVGAQASIDNSGPDAHIKVNSHVSTDTSVNNDNDVNVANNNKQVAQSGDAKTHENTTGGDATSGDASNDNSLSADLTIDNTGSGCGCGTLGDVTGDPVGSITNSGPDSKINVTSNVTVKTKISNDNNVSVVNNNDQYANTGDAKVSDNTTGGSATSGSATNTSSSTVTLSIKN